MIALHPGQLILRLPVAESKMTSPCCYGNEGRQDDYLCPSEVGYSLERPVFSMHSEDGAKYTRPDSGVYECQRESGEYSHIPAEGDENIYSTIDDAQKCDMV